MDRSGLFKLNWRDAIKGGVLAVIAALLTFASEWLANGAPFTQEVLLLALKVAGGALLAYILKNFFENNEGELLASNV